MFPAGILRDQARRDHVAGAEAEAEVMRIDIVADVMSAAAAGVESGSDEGIEMEQEAEVGKGSGEVRSPPWQKKSLKRRKRRKL